MKIQAGQDWLISSRKKVWTKIILAIFTLGLLAAIFSRYPAQSGSGWYHQLRQPVFAPPYWLPFIMWTIVYILMGSSLALIWHVAKEGVNFDIRKKAKIGIGLFAAHLLFNLIFPILLIGLQRPRVALIDMIILIIFIGILIWYYYPINRIASFLLIPYLIWIFYAAALNISIIVLN